MKIELRLPGGGNLYVNTARLGGHAAKLAVRTADLASRTAADISTKIKEADYKSKSEKIKQSVSSAAKSGARIAKRGVVTAARSGVDIAKKSAAKRSAEKSAEKGASGVVSQFREDVNAVCERDPAVHSKAEAALLYSGVHAVSAYRVAHKLYKNEHYFAARLISQSARFLTGIEIHPGAEIGHGLFIDHGSGVVIGETTIIGDNCTLYQGVTLGGTGKDTGKRHPTLGNNVMVGAGAKLLGAFTVGDNTKIAAGAVVLSDVPENSTAVGIPARVVRRAGEKVKNEIDLDQTHIPDPVSQELCRVEHTISLLERRIAELEAERDESKGEA